MIPERITYEYLARTMPTLTSAEQFNEVCAVLVRKQWHGINAEHPKGNLYGVLRALLRPEVRRVVKAQDAA